MKKGFYPFPQHLVPHVAKWLSVPAPERTVFLDPCAGEGEAINLLADSCGIPSTNILCSELDEQRAEACRSLGLLTVTGDALSGVHYPRCSLLWLNPPYDMSDSGRRMETLFLGRFTEILRRGGVLAFIVPFRILLKDEYQAFPRNYKNIRILLFPEADNQYGQCVVLATRLYGKTEKEDRNWQDQLAHPRSLEEAPEHLYQVPPCPLPENLEEKFFSETLTDDMIDSLVSQQDNLASAMIVEKAFSANKLKTLMPLRSGHQALVLATGAFDGVYTSPEDGNTLVVLGKTVTVETKVEKDDAKEDDSARVIRIAPRSEVLAWDLTASLNLGVPQLFKYV
jgi:hypothetical protein